MQQNEEIENIEITEEQIHAIYLFLSMNYDEMTIDEKLYWHFILEKIDPEYGTED